MANKVWPIMGLIFTSTLLLNLLIFGINYFAVMLVLLIFVVFFRQLMPSAKTEKDTSSDISDMKIDVKQVELTIKSISTLIAQQVAIVDIELNRVNSFIGNATADISNSVKSLKSLSEHQQTLINQIIATSSEKSLETLTLIDEILVQTDSVYSSLYQIDNLVNQTHLEALNTTEVRDVDNVFVIAANEINALSTSSMQLNEDIRNKISDVHMIVSQLRCAVDEVTCADMAPLLTIKSPSSPAHDIIHELSLIRAKASESVASAVRSLQFEDFTHQTLKSINTNLGAFLALNQLLDNMDVTPKTLAEQLLNIQRKCQEIQLETTKFDIKRSVSQVTLDEGDIELF